MTWSGSSNTDRSWLAGRPRPSGCGVVAAAPIDRRNRIRCARPAVGCVDGEHCARATRTGEDACRAAEGRNGIPAGASSAEEAEARFRLARRSVDELIRVSEEELAHRPGMEGLRKRLLASALAFYQEFIEQRKSDPAAQAELRDTTRRVETILADLAVLRTAGELYLLAQPSAHDDLRLDESQRAKVADLSERAGRRWAQTFGDPAHRRPPAERARLALEQARANEAEVDAILLPSQRVRLRQIRASIGGAGGLPRARGRGGARPRAAQRERIRAIEEEFFLREAAGRSRAKPLKKPTSQRSSAFSRCLTARR